MILTIKKIMTSLSFITGSSYAGHTILPYQRKGWFTKLIIDTAPFHSASYLFNQINRENEIQDTKRCSTRWKTVSIHLTNDEFVCASLASAFNQLHPEAEILNIIWNNKSAAQYRCTQETCKISDIERLINNTALPPEKANANFQGTSIDEGTRMLWSKLHFAGIDPTKLTCFEVVENGCLHFPLRSSIEIYTDLKTRVAYLDWVMAVTKNFNQLVKHNRISV